MSRFGLLWIFAVFFSLKTDAQVKKDSTDLRGAIDSIRDGRGVEKDNRGNIDTGTKIMDTIETKPEVPTPPSPNNPNPHDPQPSPVHPNPPLPPSPATNPDQGKPVGPDSSANDRHHSGRKVKR